MTRPLRLLPVFFVALLALTGCGQASGDIPAVDGRTRVLFVGNSYTAINGGVDVMVRGLAPRLVTSLVAPGGYGLADHLGSAVTVARIRDGAWDFVVLQEQSQRSVTDRAGFAAAATGLDTMIRAAGARTVLFMTWGRPDSAAAGVTSPNVAKAYEQVGTQLGAVVAPVGRAFESSALLRPDVVLRSEDGHPTVRGTYLAACVLYGAILRRTPQGNPYRPDGMTGIDSAYLQGVAARALGY